jgi:hypothetical protein
MFQAIGNDYQKPFPHRLLAYAALQAGNLQEAREQALESLRGNHALGHKTGMLAAFIVLAEVECREEQAARSKQIFSMVEEEVTAGGLVFMPPDQQAWERFRPRVTAKTKKSSGDRVTFGELLDAYAVG